MTFEVYWPLILALIIPWLWWTKRFTAAGLSPRHLVLSTIVRSVVVALIVLAMTQPVLRWPGAAVSIVYLLDVSQSVSPGSIQDAIQWIQQTNSAGKPSIARFIAFAGNAIEVDRLEDLAKVPVSSQANRNAIDRSQTNISGALERAVRSFAPDHLKRLVLISDGNENHGAIADIVPMLKKERIKVFAVAMAAQSNPDSWVEGVAAPSEVNADEEFPLEVRVYSSVNVRGQIEIRSGTKSLAQRTVELKKGANRVAFEVNVGESSGPVVLEATSRIPSDAFPENNTFRQPLVVIGRPRVLYVEGHPPSARYLNDALTSEGFRVDIAAPNLLPDTAEELDRYDAVILSDVSAKDISEPQMAVLSAYVRDLGGGFILAGGENVFGESGYSKTPIEDLLPITFDTRKPQQTVSMLVILDKSGSMAGDKIRYAKEATKAPLALLKDTDHFGVLTFNFNSSWVLRPQAVVDRAAIMKAIDEIGVGGETNLYPAMKEAFDELQKESGEIKHVIILSDGRTLTDDFAGLTKQMAEARITVSTVSVGQEADQELMAKIASWGRGKTYYAEDPAGVPQIFNQDLESSAGEAIQESSFKLIVTKNVEAFKGIDLQSAPRLLGYVQTKARPSAEVLLEAYKDRPLLARWQFGSGKAVAFTSDVKDRWAANWLNWNGYAKFWSQILRETMRRQDATDFDFHVGRAGDFAEMSVDAVRKDGSFRNHLHVQAHITAPDRSATVVDVPQAAPGTYRALVPLKSGGTTVFRATSNEADGATRMLAYSYPAEYHFYPADVEKLKAVSAETDGVFQPSAAQIFDTGGERLRVPIVLWPWLCGLALVLYVADVWLRRFRLFEDSWNAIDV